MYGRFPRVPVDRRWTVALLVLGLLLAVYIVWSGDPIGYVILVLIAIFAVLPALILYLGNRREAGGARPSENEAGGADSSDDGDRLDELDGNRSGHEEREDVHEV